MSSLASSTRTAYLNSWRKFTEFITKTYPNATVFPSTPHYVSTFVAHLHNLRLAPSSISAHLSAISFYHSIANTKDPCDHPIVRRMILGCRKLRVCQDIRRPLLHCHIIMLVNAVNHLYAASRYQMFLYKSVILLAFFGFFRMGELLPNTCTSAKKVVQLSHIQFHDTTLTLYLHNYKTRRSDKPIEIIIRNNGPLYPVAALQSYSQMRGPVPGPLFVSSTGDPLTIQQFRSVFNDLLSFCNLSKTVYKLHSFRIGACTQAILSGVTEAEVMLMGRWRSHAFRRYIRVPALEMSPKKK